jgi:hypothetical protein
MLCVLEAATGRLQVDLPSLELGATVIDQGIQARETRSSGEEDRQKKKRLSLKQRARSSPTGPWHKRSIAPGASRAQSREYHNR